MRYHPIIPTHRRDNFTRQSDGSTEITTSMKFKCLCIITSIATMTLLVAAMYYVTDLSMEKSAMNSIRNTDGYSCRDEAGQQHCPLGGIDDNHFKFLEDRLSAVGLNGTKCASYIRHACADQTPLIFLSIGITITVLALCYLGCKHKVRPYRETQVKISDNKSAFLSSVVGEVSASAETSRSSSEVALTVK